jgi:uncharacterized protein (TIGR00288 family)
MNNSSPISEEKRVALLIDFENIKPTSLKQIVERASIFGMVTVKRAYADWSTRSEAKNILSELGVEAIHHFRTTRAKKNASDICLAVDAMDLLYRDRADVFVLVTADSDFVRLVRRLREDGKTVVGMGSRGVVSQTLISVCDRYLFVEELSGEKEDTKGLSQAELLVRQAIENTADEDGSVLGSRLHQAILKLDPSFAYKDVKWSRAGQRRFKTFGEFLRSLPSVKMIHDAEKGGLLVAFNDTESSGARSTMDLTDTAVERPRSRDRSDERRTRGGRRRSSGRRKDAPPPSAVSPPTTPVGDVAGTRVKGFPQMPLASPPASSESAAGKSGPIPADLRSTLMQEMKKSSGVLTSPSARAIICKISGVKALRDLGVKSLRQLMKAHPGVFAGVALDKDGLKLKQGSQTAAQS